MISFCLYEGSACWGITFDFPDCSISFFGTKYCLGIEGCNFEEVDLCKAGTVLFTHGVKTLLPFGPPMILGCTPKGRPGSLPLLLPSCFLESNASWVCLLTETDFWLNSRCGIWLLPSIRFRTTWSSRNFLPVLLEDCLVLGGKATRTAKKIYNKFSE